MEDKKEPDALPGGPVPEREDTPVIVIDQPSEEPREDWRSVPPYKEDRLFWIDRSRTDEVLRTLDRIVGGQLG